MTDENGTGTDPSATMCPFIKEPSRECYCMAMSGSNIKKIVALCADDYNACPIYHSRSREDEAMLPPLPEKERELSL